MSETTPFNPAAARLDNETEADLYALYRTYFAEAEARTWNVWETIPWNEIGTTEPNAELVDAVLACYSAELFLPDYMTTLLMHTRASRARSWYVTHWCYEEGKHLLALGEWLTRRGLFTDEELQNRGAELLGTNRWGATSIDAIALYVDAILYETQEEIRYRHLRNLAESASDPVLTSICDYILHDEGTQKAYFAQALAIIQKRHPEKIETAVATISATQLDSSSTRDLLTKLIAG